ncbi:hypothetical protein [Sulfurimonas sp. HSL3-7]|uniref:hypothetical protein n=1 Tax=Sulfonitrofixus jiaomeiensis TaxID=3131938 RepID=UPI0031F89B5B
MPILHHNVYEAATTIELQREDPRLRGDNSDTMALALAGNSANLEDEQYIIQSRFLAEKVLAGLDIGTRYFTKRNYRTVELYRASPIFSDGKNAR